MTTIIDRLRKFVFSANSKSPEKSAREKAREEFERMPPNGAGSFLVFKKNEDNQVVEQHEAKI